MTEAQIICAARVKAGLVLQSLPQDPSGATQIIREAGGRVCRRVRGAMTVSAGSSR